MERDIKRSKGPDEQPVATLKEPILNEPSVAQLSDEVQAKNATIERLLKENEELQAKLKNLQRVPVKKGAQTRYWRREEHERFLEALEKFGQRDVKNIATYVGTRSPTQVRTHAQKYFLKQRREETAQMKSANLLARKRRAAAASAGEDGKELLEELGEDGEEDEEDGEDEDNGTFGPDGIDTDGPGSSSTGASSSSTTEPARRKSMRATSAATTIKLRTADLLSLGTGFTSSSSTSTSTTATSKRTTSVSALSSAGKAATSAPTAQSHSAPPTAPAAAPRKTTITGTNSNSYGANSSAYSAASAQQRAVKPQPRSSTLSAPPAMPTPPPTIPQNHYANPYGHVMSNAYGSAPNYAPFRTDIFFNADEASIFYKAVKMYERETDRTKVLMSIKEFFLPHRSIEELSTMVDMAFPSAAYDPAAAASYNSHAAAAAAAAFHPMYAAQNRMYYGDPNAGHALSGFGVPPGGQQVVPRPTQTPQPQSGALQAQGSQQQQQQTQQQQGGQPDMAVVKIDSHLGAYLSGFPQPSGSGNAGAVVPPGFEHLVHHDSSQLDGDFGNAATHVDSSSLASISDQLTERMGLLHNGSSSSGGAGGGHGNQGPNSMDVSSQQQQQQQQSLSGAGASSVAPTGPKVNGNNGAPSGSGGPSGGNNLKSKDVDDDDDSSLMSELISLTDRKNASSSSSGGLSSFLGGRPLTLSPGVFGPSGATGTTPLGFGTGMTPLMAGGTPLGFMSPLPLQFTNQPPVNPYFGAPK